MAGGQSYEDYFAEELADDPHLAGELEESYKDIRLAVQFAILREQRSMTQQQLAEASGVEQIMICRIERGDQEPTWPTLRRLLGGLRATLTCDAAGNVTLYPAEAGLVALLSQSAEAVASAHPVSAGQPGRGSNTSE